MTFNFCRNLVLKMFLVCVAALFAISATTVEAGKLMDGLQGLLMGASTQHGAVAQHGGGGHPMGPGPGPFPVIVPIPIPMPPPPPPPQHYSPPPPPPSPQVIVTQSEDNAGYHSVPHSMYAMPSLSAAPSMYSFAPMMATYGNLMGAYF